MSEARASARGRRRFERRRRTPPGSPPGTLIADPTAPHPNVRVLAYGPDALEESEVESVGELRSLLGRWPVTWVNVDGLGNVELLREIGELFGLHRLALEDVVNVYQRPKVEDYGEHLFLVTRMPRPEAAVETEQVSMFLGRDFLLTFQERAGDLFEPVRQRLRQSTGQIRAAGPDYLAYALLDACVDGFFPVLERYGERMETLQQRAMETPGPELVPHIHELRHDLLTLRRSVWPQREMLNSLVRDALPQVRETTLPYLRDCYDHCIQLMDLVETYREVTANLNEIYLASTAAHTNEIMKVLTLIATIFIPLGFVASLYGMNFDTAASRWNMPELGWAYGYPAVLALMAAVAGGLLVYFRRKGWIWAPRRQSLDDGTPRADTPEGGSQRP